MSAAASSVPRSLTFGLQHYGTNVFARVVQLCNFVGQQKKGIGPRGWGRSSSGLLFFVLFLSVLLCGAVVSCSVTALQMLWAHHWTICGFFNFWRAASCCFSKECVTRDFLIFQLSAKFSQSAIGQGSGGGAFSTPPFLLNTKKLSINRQEGGKSVPQSEP